jgi:ribonucleoside-triphosphate reductase
MEREALEARIGRLEAELAAVEGTRTEVYARIVGYYRSVRNWNAGKREEFSRRRPWSVGKEAGGTRLVRIAGVPAFRGDGAEAGEGAGRDLAAEAASEPSRAAATGARAEGSLKDLVDAASSRGAAGATATAGRGEGDVAAYTVFVRSACPGCPPVKAFLAASGLPGRMVDVDADEGLREAIAAGVMSTPTAILADGAGRELRRARTVTELRATLMPVLA